MDQLISSDPTHIGPYRLIARLGAGGMGLVYLGRSEAGRTVAVKVVQAEHAQHPEFRGRFAREVAAARKVGGSWTAAVLDADTEAAVPWVATQYIPGPDLTTVVANDFGPLPDNSVRVLANRLALALQAVHGAGLIHRDLKPSNVLVTVDGPRVIDFGIARAMDSLAGDSLHTRTGMLIGSPGFMSPEQVRGLELTPASDVFCLGAVLVYAATGRLLFGAAETGLNAHLFRVAEEEPNLTGVPEPLLDLVRQCLDKNPAERPTLQQVAARTAADAHGDADTDADGEWLPGAVLAQLGRHAAKLLDFAPETTAGTPGSAPADAPTPVADPRIPSAQPQPQPTAPPPPAYAPTAPAHAVPPQGFGPPPGMATPTWSAAPPAPPAAWSPPPAAWSPPPAGWSPPPAQDSSVPHRMRWWGLAVAALVQLIVLLDATSLHMAMPAIMADLHLRATDLKWLFAGYELAFGGLLLLGGHLADLVGRKRMLVIGLSGFAVAAAFGGLAVSSGMLVAARALQGVFAALLSPAALALVAADFPEPKARGRAFGIYAAIAVGGSSVGLFAGGWLLVSLSWRWCLFADVPLALIAVIGAATLVHDRPVHTGPRFDAPGLLLGSGGIAALIYGFQQTGSRGWTDLLVLALLALGTALLTAFFWWQTSAATALLPPYAIRDRARAGSFVTLFLAGVGTLALFPTLTGYLQNIRGYSPSQAAVAILPTAVAIVIGSTQISARLLHRTAPRNLIVPGLLLTALGLALLSLLTPDSGYATLPLPGMLLTGLGLGMALMPLLSLATAGLAAQDSGGGAAVTSTANQVGGALGTALFGSVLSSAIAARMERVPGLGQGFADAARNGRILNPRGVPPQLAAHLTRATLGGYTTTLWCSVGITLLAGLAAALLIRSTAPTLPQLPEPPLPPYAQPPTH
ncbi:MDR family MFS transporter [Streptomyces sp. GS7]|uniref:MDR family MFS transporter n=1 Tax=Streptomyces sp. GS7 TaxID=2692234 RepID=UPI0013182F0D|nr:MDR family MFS transporter [Streptomyces sp. GS7]QHC21549.1 MFS transporter [Streptomyces sp. GS7]